MITPQYDANSVREMFKRLKEIDPDLVKELRKEMRTKVSPFAKQVESAVPSEPPLSGMRYGRLAWGSVTGSVSTTPGNSRKTGNHLVSIRVNQRDKRVGFMMAERAGSRSGGSVEQGRYMIDALNQRFPMRGRGGRFAYTKFRLLRPDIIKTATTIIERAAQTFSLDLEKK